MAALEVRGTMMSAIALTWLQFLQRSTHFLCLYLQSPPGVRSQSIHRVRAEQRSASTAEGQHLYRRVPVHASHLAPKQVWHRECPRPPPPRPCHPVLCIIFAAAPPWTAQWTEICQALLSTSCEVEVVQRPDTWYKQHNRCICWHWMASLFHNLILHQTYHSSANLHLSLVQEITEDEYQVLIRNNFPAAKQSCSSLQHRPWCHNPALIFPAACHCSHLFSS